MFLNKKLESNGQNIKYSGSQNHNHNSIKPSSICSENIFKILQRHEV